MSAFCSTTYSKNLAANIAASPYLTLWSFDTEVSGICRYRKKMIKLCPWFCHLGHSIGGRRRSEVDLHRNSLSLMDTSCAAALF